MECYKKKKIMKEIIIESIKAIEDKKKSENRLHFNPTELELKKDIAGLLAKELDSLIKEGIVTVTGMTINKDRMLTIKT